MWIEQGELFTGDSIPATGEKTPIYVSAKDSIETLRKLLALDGVNRYLPAWDDIYDKDNGKAAFPSKEQIFKWLSSPEYKEIVNLRQESVETEAIIVEDIISQH